MLHFLCLESCRARGAASVSFGAGCPHAAAGWTAADAVLCVLFACLLTRVALSDIRTMSIPDRLNGAILALGCARRIVFAAEAAAGGAFGVAERMTLAGPADLLLQTAAGLVAAALPLYMLAAAFPGSIGGGDIKLAGAAGVFLGAFCVARGTAAGLVAAGVYAAAILLRGRRLHLGTQRKKHFPLGPFLAAGYVLVLLR